MAYVRKDILICDRCDVSQDVVTEHDDTAQVIKLANQQGNLEWTRTPNWLFCGSCYTAHENLMAKQQKEYERFMGRAMPKLPLSRIW
jgi:hypothetical protein